MFHPVPWGLILFHLFNNLKFSISKRQCVVLTSAREIMHQIQVEPEIEDTRKLCRSAWFS